MIDPIVIFDRVGRRIAIGREEIMELSEGGLGIKEKFTTVTLYNGKHISTDESVESLTQRIDRYHPSM